ncbi:MAG: hypothetical protein QOH73_2198 [Gaiellaceae bacterium]|nr:hypothetical protein [Gaiellaceae bacterium]
MRRAALICLAAFALIAPATALGAIPPEPPPPTTPGIQVGPDIPANPSGPTDSTPIDTGHESHPHFWDLPGRVKKAIDDWFRNLVTQALDPMMTLIGETVLSTPQIATNGSVAAIWQMSLITADALLVLFLLAGCALAMSYDTLQTRYQLKDLLTRTAFAGIAINASLSLSGQMIELSNALAAGFLGGGVDPAAATARMEQFIVGAISGGGIFLIVLGLACAIAAVILLILYLIRAVLVIVLVCAAPLMLLFHLFPQTEGLAHLWWRSMAAAFGIQVSQALVLATAIRVFFADGQGSLGFSVSGGIIDLLVALCCLFVLVKIPFWAKEMAFSGRGGVRPMQMAKAAIIYRGMGAAARGLG